MEGERLSGEVALGPGTTVKFGEVAVLFEPLDETRAGPALVGDAGALGGAAAGGETEDAAGRASRATDAASARARSGRRRRGRAGRRPGSSRRSCWSAPPWPTSFCADERGPVHFTCAARTDIGIVRSGNEDNYLMLADRGIFIVADGMGGHAAGEVASEMAVRITSHEIGSLRGLSDEQAGDRVSAAIRAANDAIFERTLAEHDKRGMGTTATVLVLMPARYLIGQVGDSRAYLLRRGEFQQLTKDHSYVQEQVDAGLLTPEQARVHPYSNVITRCVGASMDVVPDIYFGTLEQGDVLLLASDGLTGMLEDEQLTRILSADGGPQHWVDRMVTEANRRGGLDNITAIVIRIDSVDSTTGEHPRPRPRRSRNVARAPSARESSAPA